jgi:prepilin-type processing-associated H-X9-DG protein
LLVLPLPRKTKKKSATTPFPSKEKKGGAFSLHVDLCHWLFNFFFPSLYSSPNFSYSNTPIHHHGYLKDMGVYLLIILINCGGPQSSNFLFCDGHFLMAHHKKINQALETISK